MKSTIVIFGMPGVGKGTRLSKFMEGGQERNYEIVSVGNMLRAARKSGTEIGLKAATYMDAGQLVPDEIINAVVIDGMKNMEQNCITDGFPRTVNQAVSMLEAGITPTVVIELTAPKEVIIQRAKARIVCDHCGEAYTLNAYKPPKIEGVCDKCGGSLVRRKDDEEETVKNRLEVYERETYPILDIFATTGIKIFSLDTTSKDIDEQFALIMKKYS